MNIQKIADWFLTESGKSFSFGAVTTATICTLFAKTVPNTFFIDKYVDVLRLYKHGTSVSMPEVLQKRFDKAVELVGIAQPERKLYQPFLAFGFELYGIGTGYSKYGYKIALPSNFTYTNVDTIEKHLIKINNESVPWGLDEGQQLLNSLVLSENAQLYGIAREIKMGESPKFLLDTFYSTAAIIGVYGLSHYLNKRLNLYVKPLGMRLLMYSIMGAFVFGNYAFAKDYTQIVYEKKVDEFLINKDPIFVEGGKEFYSKMLNRNVALRKLLGKVGESKFSVLGNENYMLRNRHIPLIKRKEFFEGKSDYEPLL